MNQANIVWTHFCLTTYTFVFEGTVSLLLSFVFSDPSGNFPDFSRAVPDLSQWERVELSFAHTRSARATGFGQLALTDTEAKGSNVRLCLFK